MASRNTPKAHPQLRFGGADARPCDYAQARVVFLPAPYEGTVSYGKGTAQAPHAILEASAQLEDFDEELLCAPHEAGFYTLAPLALANLSPAQALDQVMRAAQRPLADGKLLITLGGEHSVSVGVWRALQALPRTETPTQILQLDAHADLRPTYQGSAYSHACVMYRAHALGLPCVQVGLRSLSSAEYRWLRDEGLEQRVFWAHRICGGDPSWMDEALHQLSDRVYITIDVDVLDPSLMPATGTPEPGGLEWRTTLAFLRKVAESRHVLGIDLCEFAPQGNPHTDAFHTYAFTVARLAHKLAAYALLGRGELPLPDA